ncbi:NfeD family protein [Flammeovirga agarivorans]|uniref:Nodulation protein NfeD n=1 Tax=Flammeovirga agarivorans TaxID=2726742 RepID=A0A7X8XVD8_9BACT|nr:NfeD family protein [Flammeovirga agarivorans]NLR90965.1 nodulation protein NfeD [Flammeovirga agarivorans]
MKTFIKSSLNWLLLMCVFYPVMAENVPVVFEFPIREDIDPRSSRKVSLALEEATKNKADYVIINMNTYGGAVNDADKIRQLILDYPQPVYVFINKNAASAGALISIACDSIYMESGSNIGAATVVMGGSGEAAPDKYQSYMRSMMRSTAETNGRNPQIAEAMVDQDLVVEGISEEGEVITFTVAEALEHGFCEAEVTGIPEIMERNGISNYELVEYSPSSVENIISIFLNPAVSSILILIILGGIYFELQSPGIGFPIAAAITAGILYLVPYYLSGMAANWELIVIGIGFLLILLEVFVVPGFGITGISGITFMIFGLTLVMLDNDFLDFTFVAPERIMTSLISVLAAVFIGGIGVFAFAHKIVDSPTFAKVGLSEKMDSDQGYSADFLGTSYIGQTGTAHTVLRPSGKVKIEDNYYDATTEGGFISKGTAVEVIEQNGSSLKVRELV